MMDSELLYYLFCLAVLIVGILAVKKIAGCLLKTVAFGVVVIVLVAIWYFLISPH